MPIFMYNDFQQQFCKNLFENWPEDKLVNEKRLPQYTVSDVPSDIKSDKNILNVSYFAIGGQIQLQRLSLIKYNCFEVR